MPATAHSRTVSATGSVADDAPQNIFGNVGGYQPCGCCGRFHAVNETAANEPLASVVADSRGQWRSGPKPSLSVEDAAAALTRSNLFWGGTLGEAATVTYAFRSTAPSVMPSDTSGFSRFSTAQASATSLALEAWADVARITFQRIDDGDGFSNNATMLFGNYAMGAVGSAAFAYLPGQSDVASSSGDVWININAGDGYNIEPVLRGYGQQVLVHEIGHALGLRHPGDYNAAEGVSITYAAHAAYAEDSRQYTVMSYFSETNTGGAFGSGRYASAPMLDDIAAIQRLYGANMATRTGDTIYGFNATADRAWFNAANGPLIFAIWDAGGIDRLDASGYSENQVIDLRQGAFSSLGGLVGNVSIAMGAVIENAIGGTGNDVIIGNSADNHIRGGGGSDNINGGLGVDTVWFDGPRPDYTIDWTGQVGKIWHSAGGSTTVTNVEFLQFSDVRIAAQPTGGLTLTGDATDDIINGSAFADVLEGGLGQDRLYGGDGDDLLRGGLGDDLLDGGAGVDTVGYEAASGPVTVNLATGRSTGPYGADTLINIENIRGSTFDDLLIGDDGANELYGGGGIDMLRGGGGNDRLVAGAPGQGGGAPDIVKDQGLANGSRQAAVSLDGGFDLLGRSDVANATIVPHATVQAVTHGGVEYYAFMALAGAEITLDVDNAAFDSTLRLYDTTGAEVARNDDNASDGGVRTDSGLTFTATVSGMHYVQVAQWTATNAGGSFTSGPPPQGLAYTLHVSVNGHAVVPLTNIGSNLYGEDGDDVMIGTRASDTFDGGAGFDTVIYTSRIDHYRVTTSNGVTTVEGDGRAVDTLRNVERLQFADGVVLDLVVSDAGTTLNGTAQPDNLRGTAGPDRLFGLAGDDRLYGGAGSDVLDGGEGIDTAVYDGLYRGYTLVSPTTVAGGRLGGTDTLTNIERIQFLDGWLSFQLHTGAAAVYRLYDTALGRAPDLVAMVQYSRALDQLQMTQKSLAEILVQSAEFQARFGALNDEAFVRALYANSGLTPDTSIVNQYVTQLQTGWSRGEIVWHIGQGEAHRAVTDPFIQQNGLFIHDDGTMAVARLYQATLGRTPDVAGLQHYRDAIDLGYDLMHFTRVMIESPEFISRFGSLDNGQFVDQIYRFVLGREPDAPGRASYVSALNSGMTRAEMVLIFSESPEFRINYLPTWETIVRNSENGAYPAAAADAAIAEPDAAIDQDGLADAFDAEWGEPSGADDFLDQTLAKPIMEVSPEAIMPSLDELFEVSPLAVEATPAGGPAWAQPIRLPPPPLAIDDLVRPMDAEIWLH